MPAPSRIRRAVSALAALLSVGGSAASTTAAEITPDQAPAAWVAYAEGATKTITGWLSAETPPAPRVRAVLEATRPAPDQPTPPLVVRIWVHRDGAISRVEFPPLADAQADQDLRALLIGHRLEPPPAHMRLPMRLGLQLAPHPAAQPAEARPRDTI